MNTSQNVIPVPPGQTPLDPGANYQTSQGNDPNGVVTSLPQGNQRGLYAAIFQSFQQNYGRNPTQQELSAFAPTFQASGTAGSAAVAQSAIAQQETPTNIAAQQQQQGLAAYQANQSQYDAQTNQVYQQLTGQNAQAADLQHFGSLLASGQIDQYGMSQLVGQTQQAQQYQTQNYQNQLSQNLQGTQADYYKNYIEPSILSQTAAAGRDPNSSGVQQAAVQAGQQQNYQLQNYLAQFGAGQYGQSAQNQQNVYQQYLGQQYGLQNANISQQLGQQNYMQNQNTNLMNYQLQQQAYNNYLQQYGQRNNGLGSLIGGGVGAALGSFGGPAGAAVGYGLGSGLGGAVQGGGNQQQSNPFSYAGLPTSWGSSKSSGFDMSALPI